MNSMLQTVKQKLIMSVMVCAILTSPAALALNYVMVRVNGMYCGLCLGGTVGQIKRASGVGKVDVWLKDGIIAITPTGNVDMNRIKGVLDNSGYTFLGAYSCPTKTANLGSCKSI